MKSVHLSILITITLAAQQTISAGPSTLSEPTIAQLIDSVGFSANKQITEILAQHVPRLSYTGLAFVTAIAGVFISTDGLHRLCRGLEDDNNKTTITGATELSTGISTVAASIAAIYLLWKRR